MGLSEYGPDDERLIETFRLRRGLSIKTILQFLRGYMYQSPLVFMPGLQERYLLRRR